MSGEPTARAKSLAAERVESDEESEVPGARSSPSGETWTVGRHPTAAQPLTAARAPTGALTAVDEPSIGLALSSLSPSLQLPPALLFDLFSLPPLLSLVLSSLLSFSLLSSPSSLLLSLPPPRPHFLGRALGYSRLSCLLIFYIYLVVCCLANPIFGPSTVRRAV
eukprot:scaffold232403_cov28-Tisochrysis_lutea.AAC.1